MTISEKWRRGSRGMNEYHCHKFVAKSRGIPFLLTFKEWLKIWDDSGHWHERGRRKGQYVMARFGDKGAYAVDNVKIIRTNENRSEEVIPKGPKPNVQGENHCKAKFSDQQILQIRADYETGLTSYRKLARKYNVRSPTIGSIIKRKTWKHI